MEYLNNEKNDSDSQPEIFEAFIYKFMEDSIFQLSRIKFPLEENIQDEDFNIDSIKVEKSEWKHIEIFLPEEYRIQIYDNFSCTLRDTDERVINYHGIENGIDFAYYFLRINGKWYLIKINDYSS